MRRSALLVPLALALAACAPGRKSTAEFRLPDGDPVRGHQAFVDLRCHSCHEIAGVDLPKPLARIETTVALGGVTVRPRTDGELLEAIVDPAHDLIGAYPAEAVSSGGRSRMLDLNEVMTVRQLVDVVAFLHEHYEYVPAVPAY
jgi:hypothetical protein